MSYQRMGIYRLGALSVVSRTRPSQAKGSSFTVANTRSARKRIRTNERKRVRNQMYRSRAKTFIKKAEQDIFSGEATDETAESIREAIRTLDKAANKGILHRNNVARRKSRLMKKLSRARAETEAATA
jgi:small subunit ribosomal protein S20